MMKRWTIVWLTLACLCLAGVVAHFVRHRPLPFDRATWDTAEYGKTMTNPKHRMALSLIKDRTLIGKAEAEVLQVLGNPMYTIDDWPTKGARQLQYGVGPSTSLMGLDFTALFVDLSAPSGVVTQARIGRRNI